MSDDRWPPPPGPDHSADPPGPLEPRRASEPMRLGTIIERAFAIHRGAIGTFALIALVSALPLAVLGTLYQLGSRPSDTSLRQSLALLVYASAALLLIQPTASGTAVATLDALHGRRPDASRALRAVGERIGPLFLVAVGFAVGVALGGAAFLIPGLVLCVIWLFAPLVVVTERRGPGASFRRSAELVRGRFWATIGTWIVLVLVFGALGLVATIPTEMIAAGLADGDRAVVLANALALIPGVLVLPLAHIALALLYAERARQADGTWPAPERDAPA